MNLFEGVIGHDRVVQMLEREAERPAHAYLFTGPSGVGKATVARRFAGALLCPGDDEGLRRVDDATHPDLHLVEPEGRTALTVDQARATVAHPKTGKDILKKGRKIREQQVEQLQEAGVEWVPVGSAEMRGAFTIGDVFDPETGEVILEAAAALPEEMLADLSARKIESFEVVFPGVLRSRRDERALAILNLANDSWFHSPAASYQQIAFGTFRAIEQRLPLIRIAQGGISVVVDPFGRVVDTLGIDEEGVLWATVSPISEPAIGERVAIAGLALGGGFVGFSIRATAASASCSSDIGFNAFDNFSMLST